MMGIVFVAVLLVKIPSPFVLLMLVAIVWIRTGRKLTATALVGREILRLLLQRLQLLLTPRLVVLALLVLGRSSTSSHLSNGHVDRQGHLVELEDSDLQA